MRVVDRVEAALGQEGQVEPVEGKDGAGVGEPPVGHVEDCLVRDPGDPDPGQVPDRGLGPGQPGRVRRPGQPADRPVVRRGQLGDLPGRHVDDQQPAVPRGGRDGSSVRGRGQAGHVPEPARGEGGGVRLATRADDLQGVGPRGVGDPDRLPGLAEHPRQPGPRPRVDVQRAGRAVLVRQPVHRAAHLDHAGLPGLVTAQAAQVVFGGDQPRRPRRGRGAQGDLQPTRLRRLGRVQDPDVAGHVVDDPLPVRGRVPCVHPVVVGVPADVAAVQRARVDVPGALVIGQEEQPGPDDHRAGQLAAEVREHPGEQGK